jgi:hypothetical protein
VSLSARQILTRTVMLTIVISVMDAMRTRGHYEHPAAAALSIVIWALFIAFVTVKMPEALNGRRQRRSGRR